MGKLVRPARRETLGETNECEPTGSLDGGWPTARNAVPRCVSVWERRHVQGCFRRPQGRAGDPVSPLPDVQGERGRPELPAQELQEHESREPRDAYSYPRGERCGGWHRRSSRYAHLRPRGRFSPSRRRTQPPRTPRRSPPMPTIHPIKCPLCLTKVPIRPPSSQTLGWRRRLLSRVWTRRRWKRRSPRSSSKLAPFLVPLGRDRLVEGPPRETLDDVILLLFTTPPRSVRLLWYHRAIHVPRLTGPEGLGCVWDRTHRQRGESNG